MGVVLLPRMSAIAVDLVLSERARKANEDRIEQSLVNLPNAVYYAPVGGTRATPENLAGIREGLLAVAREHGFPRDGSAKQRAVFDAKAAEWITECEFFRTGEALRDDVWAFVSTWLVGDLTRWRFGDATVRYHGGVRNAFQRLWLRGKALDRGVDHAERWGLLDILSEDALVQITERPSVGGQPELARAIAEGWVRARRVFGAGAMEDMMRKVIVGVRLQNEVRDFCALDDAALAELIDSEFNRAATSLGLSKKRRWF